ncbi:MAG TPA: large conductance mechanosensitive channel protein MscL [Pseudonocardiaceae bacterium]|nr:large conductance mechanosensitive channel protein MscL [Pseudonocardiaceae bacterium]
MLKGFKDFIMRGNVLDLAVAVVIGSAFTAVVTAVVTNLIKPLVAVFGGHNVDGFAYTIIKGNQATTLQFDTVITAVINFFIVALVVYLGIVYPVKKVQERRKRGLEAGPSEPTDVELLTEIRDLLLEQQGRAPRGTSTSGTTEGGTSTSGISRS